MRDSLLVGVVPVCMKLELILMSSFVSVNDVKIAYTLAGQGPCVVFLHGWMCNQSFWREQSELLRRQGYQCLTLDFRGHGQSDVPLESYSVQQLVCDLREVLKSLGIEQMVLVGHSMGGMVAQQFCLEHGEHVVGLVLVTTIAADRDGRLISKRIERDSQHMPFLAAFDRHFDHWFSSSTPMTVRDWVKKEMCLTCESPSLALVRSYGCFDQTGRLQQIGIPTLVIGTESDDSTPASQCRELAELIPQSQFVFIEGCGHFPMVENPQRLLQQLLTFLQEIMPSKKGCEDVQR